MDASEGVVSLDSDRAETLQGSGLLATSDEARLVLVLVGLLALGLVDAQVIAPILPDIAQALGTSDSWVGRTVSGYAVAAALAALLVGPISDKLGRRGFLVAAGVVVGLGSAVAALTPSFVGFGLARIATGAGAGIISALVVAAIADAVPYERRGRSMGLVATAYFAAPVLGVPGATWIAGAVGWRANYWAFAILGVLLAFSVSLWFRESVPPGLRVRRKRRSYLSFLRNRSTAAGAISAFFVTGGLTGFLLFFGAYLRQSVGLSINEVGLVFLLSGLAGSAGAYLAGPLSDRVGKTSVALAGCLGLAVTLLAVPYARGGALYALLALVGLSAAARLAPLQSLVTELVPTESRGAYVAFRNTLSQAGNATAAIVTAALYERGFSSVCFLAAGFSLAAFALLFLIEEPKG